MARVGLPGGRSRFDVNVCSRELTLLILSNGPGRLSSERMGAPPLGFYCSQVLPGLRGPSGRY